MVGRPGTSAAEQAHAALGAVERPLVGGRETAVGTDQAAAPGGRYGALDRRQSDGVSIGEDIGEDACDELVADPVGVAADASATPAHHGPRDHVACRLVPVRCDA